MVAPWRQRRERLAVLLHISTTSNVEGDSVARAIDEAGDVQSDPEIDRLRFGPGDITFVSLLEKGQFGVVEVVHCRLNNAVYARKRIQKSVALKFRDHCFVQSERDILLRATITNTPWAPHLLCAFQTADALHMVMDYAEGGSLWGILESAANNRLLESDLHWWAPQAVSAIGWCHSQGFAHRDIKPHNFVLTKNARLQLIDFGCAAPLLPARSKGGRRAIPKPYCLVPCGTCDYISPEILQTHEDALFAAEMNGDCDASMQDEGYGFETDWWSLGAVIYELAVGVAPFFSPDIKQTYSLIVDHERSQIGFDSSINLSADFKDLVRSFLSPADERLGRTGVTRIQQHPWFSQTRWQTLHRQLAPSTLMIPPVKAINLDAVVEDAPSDEECRSNPFDFSHLFKSTPGSSRPDQSVSLHPQTPAIANRFVGFSWGPRSNAFDVVINTSHTPLREVHNAPENIDRHVPPTISRPINRPLFDVRFSEPPATVNRFATPVRPPMPQAHSTIPRTIGFPASLRPTRVVSDREALRQMINCVSASARKKVLESGRKPRFISLLRRPSSAASLQVERERPKIPSLRLKTDATETIVVRRGELNASDSMDGSAPPSPSPRPGSSMSRRSGAASPYPFARSSAPSPMLEPTSTITTTFGSFNTLSTGATASRSSTIATKNTPSRRDSQSDAISTQSASNVTKPNIHPELYPALDTSHSPVPTHHKQKANKPRADPLDRINKRLDFLFGNLTRVEGQLRVLKALVASPRDSS